MNLKNYHKEDSVYFITPCQSQFSDEYLAVRKKESRVLTDEQVKKLPYLRSNSLNDKEWDLRQKTTNRFLNYTRHKKNNLTVLDVGCGNGWFSNKLSETQNSLVVGLDINELELKQASRVFKNRKLIFCYCDIFIENIPFKNKFDLITLNASIQYFKDIKLLITTLKKFLKPNGEIHILDSPFYNKIELEEAKKRTFNYYSKLGFPKMSNYYYHHSLDNLSNFDVLFKPRKSLINKILRITESPFLWIRIKNS